MSSRFYSNVMYACQINISVCRFFVVVFLCVFPEIVS